MIFVCPADKVKRQFRVRHWLEGERRREEEEERERRGAKASMGRRQPDQLPQLGPPPNIYLCRFGRKRQQGAHAHAHVRT